MVDGCTYPRWKRDNFCLNLDLTHTNNMHWSFTRSSAALYHLRECPGWWLIQSTETRMILTSSPQKCIKSMKVRPKNVVSIQSLCVVGTLITRNVIFIFLLRFISSLKASVGVVIVTVVGVVVVIVVGVIVVFIGADVIVVIDVDWHKFLLRKGIDTIICHIPPSHVTYETVINLFVCRPHIIRGLCTLGFQCCMY